MNSFKDLGDFEESKTPIRIQKNVFKNVAFVRHIGDIIDMYVPRVFKTILNISGAVDQDQGITHRRKGPDSSHEGRFNSEPRED